MPDAATSSWIALALGAFVGLACVVDWWRNRHAQEKRLEALQGNAKETE